MFTSNKSNGTPPTALYPPRNVFSRGRRLSVRHVLSSTPVGSRDDLTVKAVDERFITETLQAIRSSRSDERKQEGFKTLITQIGDDQGSWQRYTKQINRCLVNASYKDAFSSAIEHSSISESTQKFLDDTFILLSAPNQKPSVQSVSSQDAWSVFEGDSHRHWFTEVSLSLSESNDTALEKNLRNLVLSTMGQASDPTSTLRQMSDCFDQLLDQTAYSFKFRESVQQAIREAALPEGIQFQLLQKVTLPTYEGRLTVSEPRRSLGMTLKKAAGLVPKRREELMTQVKLAEFKEDDDLSTSLRTLLLHIITHEKKSEDQKIVKLQHALNELQVYFKTDSSDKWKEALSAVVSGIVSQGAIATYPNVRVFLEEYVNDSETTRLNQAVAPRKNSVLNGPDTLGEITEKARLRFVARDAISWTSVRDACEMYVEIGKRFLEEKLLTLPDDRVNLLRGNYRIRSDQSVDIFHPFLYPEQKGYNQEVVKDFQKDIMGLVVRELKASGTNDADIKATVKTYFKEALIVRLNNRGENGFQEQRIEGRFSEFPAITTITPSCVIWGKNGAEQFGENRDLESKPSGDKFQTILLEEPEESQKPSVKQFGVSSASSKSEHVVNFWQTDYKLSDANIPLDIFRHGIHSAYGLEFGSQVRKRANLSRGQEMVLSMLTPQDIRNAQSNGRPILLDISSVSLVATSGKELRMYNDQTEVYESLTGKPITFQLSDGSAVTVIPTIAACNFGTNALSVNPAHGSGWTDDVRFENKEYLDITESRVQTWLRSNSGHKHTNLVKKLRLDCITIWNEGSYRTGDSDPYCMAARLILLNALIGVKSATNCKSGKDRTSVAVAEALFLYTAWEKGMMPEPNVPLTRDQQMLLQYVLAGTGHFEIQRANTGASGFKIGDSKWVSGLSSRVGPYFAQLIEGNSRSFGS